MKRLNYKSGFTLIEIIVVLIIIGILAAIALPNLFSNIQKSRAEEALSTMSSMRSTIESCIQGYLSTDNTKCASSALFPTAVSTTNFTYVYTPPAVNGNYDYNIKAAGQASLTTADTITIARTTAGGATAPVTCTALGAVAGAC